MKLRSSQLLFNSGEIVDTPEHYALSRALGILTWGTWDHGVRPFDQRLTEFLSSFPAQDPLRYLGRRICQRRGWQA